MNRSQYAYLFIISAFLFLPFHAFAQEETKLPTLKEQFLTAWEIHQRSLPTTVKLEKTEQPDTYNYETTLFPYNGKLKINNIVISKDLDYYFDYDLGVEKILKGVAEVELPDLPEKTIYQSYPHSQRLWEKENYLLYNEEDQVWLSGEQWREAGYPNAMQQHYEQIDLYAYQTYKSIIVGFLVPILILFFVILVVWRATKQQKGQIKKFDLSIERQLESLEIQKQSLELQKEQTEILRRLDANK